MANKGRRIGRAQIRNPEQRNVDSTLYETKESFLNVWPGTKMSTDDKKREANVDGMKDDYLPLCRKTRMVFKRLLSGG